MQGVPPASITEDTAGPVTSPLRLSCDLSGLLTLSHLKLCHFIDKQKVVSIIGMSHIHCVPLRAGHVL